LPGTPGSCLSSSQCDEIDNLVCPPGDDGHICTLDCAYVDRDTALSYCEDDNTGCIPHNWSTAGESGVGDYTDTTTPECCGDDAGENYDYFKSYKTFGGDPSTCIDDGDEACVNGGHNPLDEACCNNDGDCIYNGICYPVNTFLDLNGNTLIDGWCKSDDPSWMSHWQDCDSDQVQCEGGCVAHWAYAGEEQPFGEYESGVSVTSECCGDDLG